MTLAGLALMCVGQAPPSYDGVVASVRANRRAIQSCRLHLTWMRKHYDGTPTERRSYQVWADGSKLRIDELADPVLPPEEQKYLRDRRIKCRNCLGKELDTICVFMSTGVYTVPRGEFSGAGPADNMFDPRALGLYHEGLQSAQAGSLATCLHDADWTGRTASADVSSGGRLVVLSAVVPNVIASAVPNWGTARCWIDPSRGNNPVRFELTGVMPGAESKVDITHTIEHVPDAVSGKWFPSRLQYRERRADKPFWDEDVEVVSAEVDRPVDPAVFTLAGFGVTRGMLVYPPGAKVPKYWDGSAVVEEPPLGQAETVPPPPGPPPRPVTPADPTGRRLTLAGAVLAAIIGALLIRRAWRR